MARIAQDHSAPLKQDRMIVNRETGIARLHRQLSHRRADGVQLGSLHYAKAWSTGFQSSNERDKARGKEQETNRHAHIERPSSDQIRPKERKNEEVSPNNDFDIVPL